MRTLYVAWQAPSPVRAWFPIGQLEAEPRKPVYVFRYTKGALRAHKETGFEPLPAFPRFRQRYESGELFPLFQNRVLGSKRKDFAEYLRWLDLDRNADPIEILARTGGERQTDNLEVFPRLQKDKEGTFSCRFFLHGLRYVSDAARERAALLKPLEKLQVAVELNNPATGYAVQLQSQDCHLLGWAPRYLVSDLVSAASNKISAAIIRFNNDSAPSARRILVELKGHLPHGKTPMNGPDFKPLPLH